MELELSINGIIKSLEVAANDSLLNALRREGYSSVKRGCESGECGACTVLVDGVPRASCVTLAAQTGGCTLTTVESLGDGHPLHPLQEAFIDTGAVQCGFCTPGMLLSATALLKRNPAPIEAEVREALAGNLCRCTGYIRPVQAVLRAAAVLRGESVPSLSVLPVDSSVQEWSPEGGLEPAQSQAGVPLTNPQEASVVGKAVRQIDAVKLATGRPTFVDDIELRGMLTARVLGSPHAHAIIREIDVAAAQAIPGVHAVLTYRDVPRVAYTSAGLGWPGSGPRDQYVLDQRVRFVGDRVAVVAAETAEIAEQALRVIQVEYEVLPLVLDPRLASSPRAPRLHPEEESYGMHDAEHNIAAHILAEVGDVERGFAQADLVVEGEYLLPQIQAAPLENHVAITYLDEDERLVVRSNTQTPAHVRRIIATVVGLAPRQIRVVKPSVGGDFGGKQDILIEDLCALLTIATRRPVRLQYSRAEELRNGHTRHQQIIRMKTGVRRDGTIIANSMLVLANTGAYGAHARIAPSNTGARTLPLYPCANMRFETQVVYTNLPPAGTALGAGTPQGFFALECHIDEIARQLGLDALEVRRKNWLKEGDTIRLAADLDQSKEREPLRVRSSGLPECLRQVEEKIQWREKRGKSGNERFRRGIGIAMAMHAMPDIGQEMAAATLALNEDGSFNLLVNVANSGTGVATLVAQIAAEILGVRVEDIVLHAPDTDVTPFAATLSLLTNGGAVREAAERVRTRILEVAGQILHLGPAQLVMRGRAVNASDGRSLTLAQVALHALYVENQQQIIASASWVSRPSQPPFSVQGAEVEVDTETGMVRVLRAVAAIDVGRVVNPLIIEGQIAGAISQALGYSLSEELVYDQNGRLLLDNLQDYRLLNTLDMPVLEIGLVETEDPGGPFGARAFEEIAIDAVAPAVANAVADALGVRPRQLPLTPERVLRVLRTQTRNG